MASIAQLTLNLPTDGSTVMTAGFFTSLQAAINAWGGQFMPIAGGTLQGPVTWSVAQKFPAASVVLPSNPTYPHQNIWRTVWDHVNDPSIHLQKSAPLAHASTHQIGGTDQLFGDQLGINAANPSESIKTYVDTAIASAISTVTVNYAPSTRYEIGGADVLYGNKIAISSAQGSTDVKTYVDAAISALNNAIPATPSFVSVTSASSFAATGNLALTTNGGKAALTSDGTNLTLQVPGSTGSLRMGTPSTPTAYGSFSAGGYSVGSTAIGPNSASVNGPLTTAGDMAVSRALDSLPATGQIGFGTSAQGAYLSWNLDAATGFFFSQALTVAGNLTISNSGQLVIGSTLASSTTELSLTGIPLAVHTGSAAAILGGDASAGSLELRSALAAGTPYVDFVQGASDDTTPTYTQRFALSLDGSAFTMTGGLETAFLSIGGAPAGAGSIGVASSASAGTIIFGTNGTSRLDFGTSANNGFTFTVLNEAVATIQSDGTIAVGTSTYGPINAAVAGTLTANKASIASSGIAFGGTAGFAFTGSGASYDTGLFSAGAGDLRLYTGDQSTPALAFIAGAAAMTVPLNVTGAINATTLASSGSMTVGGDLNLTGGLAVAGNRIVKFRTKNAFSLGWNQGATTLATSYPYPNVVVPALAGGTIDAIRLSALSPDSGVQTIFQITKNGTVIGTITLPSGQITAKTFPIVANTPLAEGDVLQAICTQAGSSTGVQVALELSQFLA